MQIIIDLFRPLFVTLFLALIPLHSFAEREEITFFSSDITVEGSGEILVRESIHVRALGKKIKRGIYRDIPTEYSTAFGTRKKVKLEVKEVRRNGRIENYKIESLSAGDFGSTRGKRIRIGNAGKVLAQGVHQYEIVYSSFWQLGYFESHDELYWNVTGDGWDFPIVNAEALVRLPPGFYGGKLLLDGYTGKKGEKGTDYTVDTSGSRVTFKLTRVLQRREGLTIVVGWPKGLVEEPTKASKIERFLSDNRDSVFALIGLLCVFIYYLFAWLLVGKDPDSATIIPIFESPQEMTPGELRYLRKMSFDKKAFTAEVLSIAQQGHAELSSENGKYSISRRNSSADWLADHQTQILDTLLKTSSKLTFEKSNHQKIAKAIKNFKKSLRHSHLEKHFNKNKGYFIVGALLSLAAIVTSLAMRGGEAIGVGVFMSVWLSIWTVGVVALGSGFISAFKAARAKKGVNETFAYVGVAFTGFFMLPFLAGEVMGIWFLYKTSSAPILLVIILLGILGYFFSHLLKAPTLRGQKLLDQIEGFHLYLSTAEGDELRRYAPPEKTIDLYERYLPYALALDVEQEWSEQFSQVIADASSGDSNYQPNWYRGDSFPDGNSFASSVGSSFSSAISSSSTAPGSSSGGGGGGFSGGGGGGGGGGGW